MDAVASDRFTFRLTSDERAAIEAAARREGVSVSVVIREGALLRARRAERGVFVEVGSGLGRRLRAAAELDGVGPEEWALTVLGRTAARRLGSVDKLDEDGESR